MRSGANEKGNLYSRGQIYSVVVLLSFTCKVWNLLMIVFAEIDPYIYVYVCRPFVFCIITRIKIT